MPDNTPAQYTNTLNNIGLFRRLFAIFYDCLLLLAILFITTAIANAINQGNAIEPDDTYYPLFVIIVFALSFLYFAWFWIYGGQTLGMKTWRIQIRTMDDRQISWKTAIIRYLAALLSWSVFALGFIWSLFDKKKHCWHDKISHTELIDLR